MPIQTIIRQAQAQMMRVRGSLQCAEASCPGQALPPTCSAAAARRCAVPQLRGAVPKWLPTEAVCRSRRAHFPGAIKGGGWSSGEACCGFCRGGGQSGAKRSGGGHGLSTSHGLAGPRGDGGFFASIPISTTITPACCTCLKGLSIAGRCATTAAASAGFRERRSGSAHPAEVEMLQASLLRRSRPACRNGAARIGFNVRQSRVTGGGFLRAKFRRGFGGGLEMPGSDRGLRRRRSSGCSRPGRCAPPRRRRWPQHWHCGTRRSGRRLARRMRVAVPRGVSSAGAGRRDKADEAQQQDERRAYVLSRATSIAAMPCVASFRPVASPKASASAISFRRDVPRRSAAAGGAVRMLADECPCRYGHESPFRDKGGQLCGRMFECPVTVDDQQYGRGSRAAEPLHAFQGQGRHVASVDRYGEQGHGIGGQCLRCSRVGQVDGADFGCC